ncbi:MAG: DUF881 domain-containing protein [Bifidobacteriaceae bacterium]|jgi:uncharacterized protein YlxW (UPF0749 family)|nr:DUF881 domain-containing protein [Bifidobacteriaceae bacterium]
MTHPKEPPRPGSPQLGQRDRGGGGRRSAWQILGRALLPRFSRAQATAALLCAALGFAAVTQVRHAAQADYSGLRESDLVELLDRLSQRTEDLSGQNLALETQLRELESTRGQAEAAAQATDERVRIQGILAGTLPAEGPGVILRVYDTGVRVTASTLYHLVQELRNAGAEAMSLGDTRITASTWIADGVQGGEGVIEIDGTAIFPPYEFRAIGDPETIEVALNIPGGALAVIRSAGGTSYVTRESSLTIEAIAAAPTFEFASPVPEP